MIVNIGGAYVDPYALAVGESNITRALPLTAQAQTLSALRIGCFMAGITGNCSGVRMWSGGTVSATLDLARIGLYQLDSTGTTWNLVAATVSDPTLFNTANTAYARNWAVPVRKVAGQRYALGVLQVAGAGTAGNVFGLNTGLAQESAAAPRIGGVLNAQSDLPTTFADVALSSSAQLLYGALLP